VVWLHIALALTSQERILYAPLWATTAHETVSLIHGKDHWKVEFRSLNKAAIVNRNIDRYIIAWHNGKEVWRESLHQFPVKYIPTGDGCRVVKPRVQAPYPVLALRSTFADGRPGKTLFYGLIRGKLLKMGLPPTPGSRGPVNFKGRQDLWLFDDESNSQLRHHLYKLSQEGKLRPIRSWVAAERERLRDTVELGSSKR
jgi:hypothetical protein